jgi:hypothetical protein
MKMQAITPRSRKRNTTLIALAITDPHLRAEFACRHGHCKLLADYFKRTEWPPSHEVLKALSRHLDGSNNWNLRIVVRDGRPPKIRSGALWEEGQEGVISSRLYLLGEGIANNSILRSEIQNAQKFLIELADALDPAGTGKWKLSFKHPRRGNPSTSLRRTIKLAVLGHQALALYAVLKNWRKVDDKLDEDKPDATDSKLRKLAVRLVRNPGKFRH